MPARGLVARGVPKTLPKWLLYVKIAIIVLALVVLALSAYAIAIFNTDNDYYYSGSGAPGLLIFVAIKTIIFYGLVTLIQLCAPRLFFRILALIAYLLGILFWMASWGWAASVSAVYFSLADTYSDSSVYGNLGRKFRQEGAAMAACAAIGAIAWVLSIVNAAVFIKACLRDPDSAAAASHQQAELGQVPHKAQEAQGPAGSEQGVHQGAHQQAPDGQPQQGQSLGGQAVQQQSGYDQPNPVYAQPAPIYSQSTEHPQQPNAK